ncbi:MAG: twin-arginine translocase subunit TatC [Candidatus Anammoximicrobium sp.]|nr:twin-arginine translocase subunit TatC [Candidatus Anammoximicrobium sp.]
MPKRPDDDLFAETTMSFGDHLEELRVCLFKSVLGLVFGFLIGLALANWVVAYIQTPLKKALEDHFISKAIGDLQREYGQDLPPDVHRFVEENRLVFEKMYVEKAEWKRVGSYTASAAADEKPASQQPAPAKEKPKDGRGPESLAPEEAKPAAALEAESESPLIVGEKMPVPRAPLIATRVWRPIQTVVKALNAQEAFMIWMKAGFVVGLVIASPYIFLQIWSFVAAGLYPHEKRYVHLYLPFSLILFLTGAATAFFIAFRYVLKFLFGFNAAMQIDPDPRISEWLGFVLMLPLAFGVAFQLPLVMLFLHRVGIFSLQAYLAKWRLAVLIIFVAAMIITPTADPVTMLLMALPMTGLYFLGIGLCKWMPRNKSPFSEGYEP